MTTPDDTSRRYNSVDTLLIQIDQTLATLLGQAPSEGRPSPAGDTVDAPLADSERRDAARLMRVNHTGEVCAQALYQGQALTATPALQASLQQAGREEGDHLRWCRQRIDELGGRPSILNPLFYAGSLALGAAAGLAGDRWSLGFLVETERQVERHLDGHLDRLPPNDDKSRVLLTAMRDDEARHADQAEANGATPLPGPVRAVMALTSKLMTRSTYWV